MPSRASLPKAAAQSFARACNRANEASTEATSLLTRLLTLLAEIRERESATQDVAHMADLLNDLRAVLVRWRQQDTELRRLADQLTFMLQIVQERAAIDPRVLITIARLVNESAGTSETSAANLVWERRRRSELGQAIFSFVSDVEQSCDRVEANNDWLTIAIAELSGLVGRTKSQGRAHYRQMQK